MAAVFNAEGDNAELATPRNPSKLQSLTAFARFEFEPGKSNDGTKILMVEWEDDDVTRDAAGVWHVSWSGKQTVLPADDQTAENTRRFYFLLPPGVTIPPTITLTYEPPPNSAKTIQKPDRVTMNPLPAIFPPELGATARASGKKGVLHTIWAKKRLQALEKEIDHEQEFNLEGIALEMALREKEWIEKHFSVTPRPLGLDTASASAKYPSTGPVSPGLGSPRSPGGSRLSEKLRGLSIGTSDKDLARRYDGSNTPSRETHPLSPESPDVAISSFTSFRNTPVSGPPPMSTTKKKMFAPPPPEHIQAQQSATSVPSMDFVARSSNKAGKESDDLFAKPLSPRTPADTKSPFSFSNAETMPYLKGKTDQ